MNRDQPSRRMDEPEPCFVKLQRVRGGPPVGARIFHRLGMLAGEINGQPADIYEIWHAGELIDEARYRLLMTDPPPDPWLPVYVTDRGLAERVREAEEADYWFMREIR